MCLNACVRAIRLTVRYTGYRHCVLCDLARSRSKGECSACWHEDIATCCCYLQKSKHLQCHDAAVESTKQSARVKPVYSCLFGTLFILNFGIKGLVHLWPGLTLTNSTFCPHSVSMCFVWIWEQTAIISLYSINWLVFITETECLLRGTDWIFDHNAD